MTDLLPQVLSAFLESQDFESALAEIRKNSASLPAFRKRFWRWFNMFRILKFVHYAREHGYPDEDVVEAAHALIKQMGHGEIEIPHKNASAGQLLEIFRGIDLNSR